MAQNFEFKVGETYANRREKYTVLAIEGPNLKVRFEDGREGTLDMAMQARIISNMLLPPAVPEPPPRVRSSGATSRTTTTPARSGAATPPAPAAPRGRKSSTSAAAAAPSLANTAAGRRSRAVHSDLTLPQLASMPREERRDKLGPLLETREAFMELIERSVEAERDRFRLFSPDHVRHLQETEIAPTRSDPEQLLSYALLHNRGYLDGKSQQILARRYPLLEGGVEAYLIDMLAYDTTAQTAIVVETRVKSTQRQWLWEALLEGLRNWIAFSRAANVKEMMESHPLEAPAQLAVLAPASFWTDNTSTSLPKISDFQQQARLNEGMLKALREWQKLHLFLLQVPDAWLREADEEGRPSVSPVSGFQTGNG